VPCAIYPDQPHLPPEHFRRIRDCQPADEIVDQSKRSAHDAVEFVPTAGER
jgi:hypothetical protein